MCTSGTTPALPTNTTPTFDTISANTPLPDRQDDAAFHAMLHRGQHPPRTKLVTAIADTGASHVLLRASDAHVLEDVVFTPTHETPYAVWKAANGADMATIGRGVLRVGTFNLPAFVFRDRDLASNLLGVAPFSQYGCTATFTPNTLHIAERTGVPILTGERELSRARTCGSYALKARTHTPSRPRLGQPSRTHLGQHRPHLRSRPRPTHDSSSLFTRPWATPLLPPSSTL
jgi:hypothetical protein